MFDLESWILIWKIFGDHEDWTGVSDPSLVGKRHRSVVWERDAK
jgi:hypothetical protein